MTDGRRAGDLTALRIHVPPGQLFPAQRAGEGRAAAPRPPEPRLLGPSRDSVARDPSRPQRASPCLSPHVAVFLSSGLRWGSQPSTRSPAPQLSRSSLGGAADPMGICRAGPACRLPCTVQSALPSAENTSERCAPSVWPGPRREGQTLPWHRQHWLCSALALARHSTLGFSIPWCRQHRAAAGATAPPVEGARA